MDPIAKIFLRTHEEYVFGPGRRELLAAVEELGSLRKAAQKLGMSYRWAWGRLKKAEEELGVPLLSRTDEPVGGKPKVLTPQARELLAWYGAMEDSVRAALSEADKKRPSFLGALPVKNPPTAGKKNRIPLD